MGEKYRHGDVLLKRVGNASKNQVGESKIVLAEGEVTGHKHVLSGAVREFRDVNGQRMVEVQEQAELTHEEHAPITVGAGVYQVVQQREYSVVEGVRAVAD